MERKLSTRTVIHYGILAFILVLCAVTAYYSGSLAPLALAGLVASTNKDALAPGEVWVDRAGPQPFYEATAIQNFDGMTTRDYLKYFKDGVKFARDHARYDSRILVAGATIQAGTVNEFFQVKSGDIEVSLDGGTNINKTDYHTNMQEGVKIEKGASMIVDSLQIECTITHREYNGFANGQPNTAVVTATDTSSATNHMLALDRTIIFELWRGQKLLAEGTLSDFPSEGGFYASFGGSTPEGFIQNGFGVQKHLREIIVLDAGYLFKLKARQLTALTGVLNVEIRPKLCGLLVETVG
jgi:hypothetical protein